ncbi:hypothetical protein DsansV1_C23g0180151 [Dioscorea sansibarensis]
MCLQSFFLEAAQTPWLEGAVFISRDALPLRCLHQSFCLKAAQSPWLEGAIFVSQFTPPLRYLEKLQRKRQSDEEEPAVAMYSSLFGGAFTLDSTLMCIPIDGRMVHIGRGVFDTIILIDGLASHFCNQGEVLSVILPQNLENYNHQPDSGSQCKVGTIRYWLSSGPGDFRHSPRGCSGPAFYAAVIMDSFSKTRKGIIVITTSTVAIKFLLFASL